MFLQLPDSHETWKLTGYDCIEYRNDSNLNWDEIISEKVRINTNLHYEVRITRFSFGLLLSSNDMKKTRFHSAFTVAEQNNHFFLYLEDEDEFLPENTCLDLKTISDQQTVLRIVNDVLSSEELLVQLEERKMNYKFFDDYNAVRTFRRLQTFITTNGEFESLLV